jgi:hypothetical protein
MPRLKTIVPTLVSLCALSGCAHAPPPSSGAASGAPFCAYASANDGIQSVDILCREPVANHVKARHVLVGWRDLGSAERPVDPRAADRSQAQAQELARSVLEKLRAGEPIVPLMAQYSEDPGSAESGRAYDVSPEAPLVSGFKSLSMRLNVGEVGVVQSSFGYHVIQRSE